MQGCVRLGTPESEGSLGGAEEACEGFEVEEPDFGRPPKKPRQMEAEESLALRLLDR